jgi:hypothetical protein
MLLLCVQMDSNNVTTVRYTLPRSVAQLGCQLYGEGHFSIPASLVGPPEVSMWLWDVLLFMHAAFTYSTDLCLPSSLLKV